MADNPEFKYLAIKNWDRYQSAKKNCLWIKDYVDKDFDPDISKLTVFQRGLLDMCCRLRGRHARNLSNDPQWIVGAVSIMPQERRNAMSSIGQLIAKGFLILTNEQHSLLDKSRRDKSRKEHKTISAEPTLNPAKPVASPQPIRPETSSGLKAVMLLPLNSGEFVVSESDIKKWKEFYPAVDVPQQLRNMAAWCDANPTKRKTKSGVKAFINRWLAKAQNNPNGAALFQATGVPNPPKAPVSNESADQELERQLGGSKKP